MSLVVGRIAGGSAIRRLAQFLAAMRRRREPSSESPDSAARRAEDFTAREMDGRLSWMIALWSSSVLLVLLSITGPVVPGGVRGWMVRQPAFGCMRHDWRPVAENATVRLPRAWYEAAAAQCALQKPEPDRLLGDAPSGVRGTGLHWRVPGPA